MFVKIECEMSELVICEFIIQEMIYPKQIEYIGKFSYPYYIVFKEFNEKHVNYEVIQDLDWPVRHENVVAEGSIYFVNCINEYIGEFYDHCLNIKQISDSKFFLEKELNKEKTDV